MKPLIRRMLSLAAPTTMAVMVGQGCADSDSMIFVRQVQAPTSEGSTGTCTTDSSPTGLSYEHGVLDVAFRRQYSATLLVGSQLVARGNSSQLRTETSRVALEGTIVQLADSSGAVVWGPVTVPGSGFVDPASGTTPSFGAIDTILLGADFGQKVLYPDLSVNTGFIKNFTASVRVFGHTLGGTAVESGDASFPIQACYGCLVKFPPEASSSPTSPNCSQPPASGSSLMQPCRMGQDEPVDCRICKQTLRTADKVVCDP